MTIGRLLSAPLPKRVGFDHILGSCLAASILLQAITGILLSLYYSSAQDQAFESVHYIEEELPAGRIIRGVHHWGATATVVLLALHLLTTFVRGAYKGERRWTWVSGVLLLLIILGSGFTGTLLPNDLQAYFGLQVGGHVAGLMPVIGDTLVALLLGGPVVEPWTLQRLFTFHAIVLPAAIGLLVLVHFVQIARRGLAGDPGERTLHPDLLPQIAAGVLVLVIVLLALAAMFGAPLEDKADPSNTTFNAHPEWYFFGLQQLLRLFSGATEVFAAVILPAVVMLVVLLAPWIDRNPETHPRKRPLAMGIGATLFFGWIGMTVWGYASWRAAEGTLPPADGATAVSTEWVTDPERIDNGLRLYQDLNCGLCHDPEYPGVGRGINVPSELASAGDRLQPLWTMNYLEKPHRIRWEERDVRPVMRMPDYFLTAEERMNLAAYLNSLHDRERVPQTQIDWGTPNPALKQRGQNLFVELQCGQCHRTPLGGFDAGPDLTHVGSKVKDDYLVAIIHAARRVIPGTPMDDYSTLSREDVEALARYLRTLR